jgi:hypothetical protein
VPLTQNPFTDDPDKAEVFEQGYLAGFQDPSSDPQPPFSPEFLDLFNQGLDAGREDAIQSPPSDGKVWVSKSELSEGTVELIEHVVIEGIAEIASTSLSGRR